MAKNSVIVSVSMTREDAEFLDRTDLSPSGLIQEKIEEKRVIFNKFDKEKDALRNNIQAAQNEIKNLHRFLESKDLFDEFFKWRGKNVEMGS